MDERPWLACGLVASDRLRTLECWVELKRCRRVCLPRIVSHGRHRIGDRTNVLRPGALSSIINRRATIYPRGCPEWPPSLCMCISPFHFHTYVEMPNGLRNDAVSKEFCESRFPLSERKEKQRPKRGRSGNRDDFSSPPQGHTSTYARPFAN